MSERYKKPETLAEEIDMFSHQHGLDFENDEAITYDDLCKSLFTGTPLVFKVRSGWDGVKVVNVPIVVRGLKVIDISPAQAHGYQGATDLTFQGLAGTRYVDGTMCFRGDGRKGRCLLWFRNLYTKT